MNNPVKDTQGGEKQMESMLAYIKQKGWAGESKPNFVMNRNVIGAIPSSTGVENFIVFKTNDVQVIVKTPKEKGQESEGNQMEPWKSLIYGVNFEHHCTKTANEPLPTNDAVTKAVLKAHVPRTQEGSNNSSYSILYSAQIDGIDDKRIFIFLPTRYYS